MCFVLDTLIKDLIGPVIATVDGKKKSEGITDSCGL